MKLCNVILILIENIGCLIAEVMKMNEELCPCCGTPIERKFEEEDVDTLSYETERPVVGRSYLHFDEDLSKSYVIDEEGINKLRKCKND